MMTHQCCLPALGTKVRVIHPIDSHDEGWIAVPMDFNKDDLPENYVLIEDRYGHITAHDGVSERSQKGKRPIVVEQYMYLEFHPQYWR